MWHNSKDMLHTDIKIILMKAVRAFLFSFVCILILSSSVAYADTSANGSYGPSYDCNGGLNGTTSFVPLACYSQSPQFTTAFNSSSLPEYINNVFKIILSVGAIMAVLRIAYGGFMYMGSADMWGNEKAAKEIIQDALIGLLLLFAIYLILYQINPNLLNLNVTNDIKSVSPSTNTTNGGASGSY